MRPSDVLARVESRRAPLAGGHDAAGQQAGADNVVLAEVDVLDLQAHGPRFVGAWITNTPENGSWHRPRENYGPVVTPDPATHRWPRAEVEQRTMSGAPPNAPHASPLGWLGGAR